ncbi:MAG: hypothetical protein A2W90_09950 [Bacteroidetes bacterium GWF2_42_66]|nr:MAG: hypothetical protein A2W92_05050 [Bacteroidetes bacterium GWA2_42_15]OFX97515.1 MAG: hypothetical protein A2W89_01455 [Bacteroidetes bacterium GWE2_42_39]OFY43791.1 MAG: hypothetical protein A2W90_09950 [Bacteroidetes bacterium GWF2_42_66]HBL76231.1 hypothetical protein [Prolixibacteraceae bacterium]HCR89285.1 hypothetical protein [Prolixibacteraceae bacterium]
MEPITSIDELRNTIQILEFEHSVKKQLLKEQVYLTYESLKPANLIRNILQEISSSPDMADNILSTTVGLASGYISKKIVVGGSANIIRKLLGSLLQLGVTTIVAQHPDTIKSIGQFIFQHFLRKKK